MYSNVYEDCVVNPRRLDCDIIRIVWPVSTGLINIEGSPALIRQP